MTSIIRLHPNLSDDPSVLEQMLGYARTALSLLTELINHGNSLTNMHTLTISIVW
jgi:acyl-CoA thioesterase